MFMWTPSRQDCTSSLLILLVCCSNAAAEYPVSSRAPSYSPPTEHRARSLADKVDLSVRPKTVLRPGPVELAPNEGECPHCAPADTRPASWEGDDTGSEGFPRSRNVRRSRKGGPGGEALLSLSEVLVTCAEDFHLFSCAMGVLVGLCNLSLLDVGTWALTQVKTGPLLLILPLALFVRWIRKLVALARRRLSGYKLRREGEEGPDEPTAGPPARSMGFWSTYSQGLPILGRGSTHLDLQGPKCPLCGGPMVVRQGTATRTLFWGCQKFRAGSSHCAGTRDAGLEALIRVC